MPGTLKEALPHAIAYATIQELRITIGIQALHFRPGLSYLEWGNEIVDTPTGFATAAAPAAATADATPAPAPGPAPPSLTDVATVVAAAVMAVIAPAPAPTVMVTTPPTPSATHLRMLFNPNFLPNDAQTRHSHKHSWRILTTVFHAAFNGPSDPCNGMHCWINPGLEKTTCASGSVFFHIPIDEKLVMKNPVLKLSQHVVQRRGRWLQHLDLFLVALHGAIRYQSQCCDVIANLH